MPNASRAAAETILETLAARYAPRRPPWTDDRAVRDVWMATVMRYPPEAGEAAVDKVCEDKKLWFPNLNEFLSALQAESRRILSERAARASADSRFRCDGTGWRDTGSGYWYPCKACNPFLYDEWISGRLLDTGRERTARRDAWASTNGEPPPPCSQQTSEPVPPSVGRAVAWGAYVEECERQWRDPTAEPWGPWASQLL